MEGGRERVDCGQGNSAASDKVEMWRKPVSGAVWRSATSSPLSLPQIPAVLLAAHLTVSLRKRTMAINSYSDWENNRTTLSHEHRFI